MTAAAGGVGNVLNNGMAPQLGQMLQIPLQKVLPLYGAQVGASANQQR